MGLGKSISQRLFNLTFRTRLLPHKTAFIHCKCFFESQQQNFLSKYPSLTLLPEKKKKKKVSWWMKPKMENSFENSSNTKHFLEVPSKGKEKNRDIPHHFLQSSFSLATSFPLQCY